MSDRPPGRLRGRTGPSPAALAAARRILRREATRIATERAHEAAGRGGVLSRDRSPRPS